MKPAQIARLLLIAAALPLVAHAQQKEDPQALQKRIAALEAGQQAILKELQEIKALLQTRTTTTVPTAAASAGAATGPVSVENAPSRGDAKAPITIVEFSDFECPFCSRYVRDTYSQIQREYVDTGKVRYVFRNFPLEGLHPQAFGAAVAGECARAQGKFWEMHDRMFANQRALTQAGLMQTAAAIGLDTDAFGKCLASDAPKKKVRDDLADAAALNASATPTFFFGTADKTGKVKVLQRIQGAKTFAVFKSTVDALLAGTKD